MRVLLPLVISAIIGMLLDFGLDVDFKGIYWTLGSVGMSTSWALAEMKRRKDKS